MNPDSGNAASARPHPRRLLLIASTTGYQVRAFAEAARNLGLDLVLATDRCHVLDNPWGDDAVPLRFEDPAAGLEALTALGPFDGIAAVGDRPAFVAAQVADRLKIPFSPPNAVLAASNKFLSRQKLRSRGVPVPNHRLIPLASDPRDEAVITRYPSVLKPLELSGSRGVIRADNAREFVEAFHRIKKLRTPARQASILVEDFIPGREYALEGLVTSGRLSLLALFDKPDPLEGPFFEETIYTTPSREPIYVQQQILETTQTAVSALGLTHGPVHAEMRVNTEGVWILEVAARPIGGLCSRVLRFEKGEILEEIVLRHALGEDVSHVRLAAPARGVMMIPIPRAGVYEGVRGLGEARKVLDIEEIIITAKEGQMLEPLPEGGSYAGFIFAQADSPERVERALRESHGALRFQLADALPVVR